MRIFRSRWFLRWLMVFTICLNGWNLVTLPSPWWVLSLIAGIALIAMQALTEWRWRDLDKMRWKHAAEADDPIASLAASDYIRRLSMKQLANFTEYVAEHPEVWRGELDDAPPLVRDYFQIGENAPQERP